MVSSDILTAMYAHVIRGIVAFILVMGNPAYVAAGEMSVTPAVIDHTAKPRDILKESITILNTSDRKLNIYPSVNDINVTAGEQEFSAALNADDRSTSLANWIELSRGVIELGPGEEKVIPFVIRVHLNAQPNDYHATISFSEGSTRETAEAKDPLATLDVNIDVEADVKEVLQLNKFFTDRLFLAGDDVLFNYQLENIGNQDLTPKGEIRIYDRTGKEVAAVDVNSDKQTISPDQVAQLASAWTAASGFGRYKAFLSVDYGASQKASVQDTVFFWVVPWQQLTGLIGALLVAIIFLALYFHRMFEMRHQARLAHALHQHGIAPAPIPEPQPLARPQHALLPFSRSEVTPKEKQPPEEPPKAEKPKLRDVLHENRPPIVRDHTSRTHAIDLKNVQAHAHAKHTPHHVINLKNHS